MNPLRLGATITPMLVGPALLLSSCGGSTRHTIATNTTGSLQGIDFVPADHTLRVNTGTKCRVYWHTGYSPPSQFVVSLKKVSLTGKKESVRTELNKVGDGYVWELAPVIRLSAECVYFIEVDAAPEYEISMFLTEPDGARSPGGTAPDSPDRGAFSHRVVVTGERASP